MERKKNHPPAKQRHVAEEDGRRRPASDVAMCCDIGHGIPPVSSGGLLPALACAVCLLLGATLSLSDLPPPRARRRLRQYGAKAIGGEGGGWGRGDLLGYRIARRWHELGV